MKKIPKNVWYAVAGLTLIIVLVVLASMNQPKPASVSFSKVLDQAKQDQVEKTLALITTRLKLSPKTLKMEGAGLI
jgi:hypothetical protein